MGDGHRRRGRGVAVIAGTGSNVFGVGPKGAPWRAGGWGHLLGDEGGGYWLGVQSIKAAPARPRGLGAADRADRGRRRVLRGPSVEALASLVYSKPLTKSEIAAFAVETAKLADDGDAVAREIYQRGAASWASRSRR